MKQNQAFVAKVVAKVVLCLVFQVLSFLCCCFLFVLDAGSDDDVLIFSIPARISRTANKNTAFGSATLQLVRGLIVGPRGFSFQLSDFHGFCSQPILR